MRAAPAWVLVWTAALSSLFALAQNVIEPDPEPVPAPQGHPLQADDDEGVLDYGPLFAAIGLDMTDEELEQMVESAAANLSDYVEIRGVELGPNVAPWDPTMLPRLAPEARVRRAIYGALPDLQTPSASPSLQGAPLWTLSIAEMGAKLRAGEISVVELTRAHLDHLIAIDRELACVITLLEARAMAQAEVLDAEIARGAWRGPLHGIPWGAKDLLAVAGAPTTWGAEPFREQRFDTDAEVVERLDAAGAVLLAKLSLGALAMGDVWFGGRTNSPWNPKAGSSGSSAGSAAAVSAGGVAFAIGSETLGSLMSPSVRCGVSSLRPTFGRVSRVGAMPLSWSMDKLGPMARTIQEAMLVMDVIAGPGSNPAALADSGLVWSAWQPDERPLATTMEVPLLRVGLLKGDALAVEIADELEARLPEGVLMQRIELPTLPLAPMPSNALVITLSAEAAASFDALTRDGRDDMLVSQAANSWPNVFRTSRLIPAVEYIQAMRARSLLTEQMQGLFDQVDVIVHSPFVGDLLTVTNLTGHPALVMPVLRAGAPRPRAISMTAGLGDEALLARVAAVWQRAAPRVFPPAFASPKALDPAPEDAPGALDDK